MADISKITLPSGTTYNLKDAWARERITDLSGYTKYLGVTTTEISDGSSTNPVVINGEDVTAIKGDIVNYGSGEFIYNGSVWQEFGDLSALGDLAYKDTASGTFTPNGSITAASFTGSSTTMTGTFTPAGTISGTTFTGASMTSTGTFTPTGTNAVTVAAPTSGETKNYTPSGTVSKPTVTPSTDTVAGVDTTAIATAVTGIDSAIKIGGVTNETLSLVLASPTTQAAVGTVSKTVVTGVDVAAPTFTGSDVLIKSTFTGTQGSVSVSGTTTGSVTDGTFTGTSNQPVSVSGTPQGDISVTWTGSATSVTVE